MSKKLTSYRVIEDYRLDSFIIKVNDALEDGWKLAAGISVAIATNGIEKYFQAIYFNNPCVKYKPTCNFTSVGDFE